MPLTTRVAREHSMPASGRQNTRPPLATPHVVTLPPFVSLATAAPKPSPPWIWFQALGKSDRYASVWLTRNRVPLSCRPVSTHLRGAEHRIAGADRVRQVGVEADVGVEPVDVRAALGGEQVERREDAAVAAGQRDRLAVDPGHEAVMPVGVDVGQRALGAAEREPVGGDLPGRAAVDGARAAQVAADQHVVGVALIDRDREIVLALTMADVEGQAVRAGGARRGVGRHRVPRPARRGATRRRRSMLLITPTVVEPVWLPPSA